MAQAGYTPIQLYHSTTPTNAPSSANLLPGELAINTADGKLYYEDSSGNVQLLASKDATANAANAVTTGKAIAMAMIFGF